MICSNCGTQANDGDFFCKNCNQKLPAIAPSNPPQPSQETIQKTQSAQTSNSIAPVTKVRKDLIKCGNCNFSGPGEVARRTVSIIFAWILFLVNPLITIFYYLFTDKYRCPNCKSNFVGVKNKQGQYVSVKKGGIITFILIAVLMFFAVMTLLTLTVVSLNSARMKARDARRVVDISLIQEALERYHTNTGSYPSSLTPGQAFMLSGKTYMEEVPVNPTPVGIDCVGNPEYKYVLLPNKQSYEITYCLEGEHEKGIAGINTANSTSLSIEK